MIAVIGETFTMGCTEEQSECVENEKPNHQVTLSDFYIGKFEVTQKQWRDLMVASTSLTNPSSFSECDNCPVENVSWKDVQEFIEKLNQKTGKAYRLPTEAEWEYAARGGALALSKGSVSSAIATRYSGSNNIDEIAWHTSNSGNKTHLVGQKIANQLGIYDMSGNVWEWCGDWYNSDYYKNSPSTNPVGPLSGSSRVLRGGSWYNYTTSCRVSKRYSYNPHIRDSIFGFRLVLVP
jgi:formylglycine-generating enzyme required for sulfatase activity